MSNYLNHLSVFMGESKTENAYLERRIAEELSAFGAFAKDRFDFIHFGCGWNGRAKTFRDSIEGGAAELIDERPEFFITREYDLHAKRLEISQIRNFIENDRRKKPETLKSCFENIDANLDFKRKFLQTGGVRVVFPGAFATRAEKAVSIEETDTAHRVSLDSIITPTIVFNIERADGRGSFDGDRDALLDTLSDMPFLKGKQNIVRYVNNAVDAIALIEAYERLGPVKAYDLEAFVPVVAGVPVDGLDFDYHEHLLRSSQMNLDIE